MTAQAAPARKSAVKFCGLAVLAPIIRSIGATAGTSDDGSELAKFMIPRSLAGFSWSGRTSMIKA
ncbi:hypothetical protein D3C74_463930 [compost metagenome]